MRQKLKLLTLILFICAVFQNSYSQQNTNGWYWINSQPQSNTLNWVKIIDATHYYAVGANGTFMKSSDGGDTWVINTSAGIPETLFGSGGTNALNTGWFFDANTGYVAGQSASGDGGYIRRTTNGGDNFTSIGLGIPSGLARVTDIYFINSTTGFICGNSTVKAFKTTDAGLSWTLMPNLPAASNAYSCIYAIDENNVFMGIESAGLYRKILRTTDGGSNWLEETLPGTSILTVEDIVFQNSGKGYLCGNNSYFAFTTNGGINWTQAVFPIVQQQLKDIEIVGSDVYTLGSNTTYYFTSNNGVSWDSVNFNDPSNINQPYPGGLNSFDLKGSDVIVVGLNGKINVSNDAGSAWRNKNYSVGNNQYLYSSIYAEPGTGKVWSGANGGLILYSTNRGTNWVQQQTSVSNAIFDIDMVNTNTGYAAGGSFFAGTGYCLKTTNSGTSWATTPIPTPTTQVNAVDFVNINTGWIVGFAGVSKTTNGGVSWFNQTTNTPFSPSIAHVDMHDANTGYCLVSSSVWKTTNGGNNWNKLLTLPSNLSWNKVQTFSNSILYLGGTERIYKSFDAGATWDSVFIPSTGPTIFDMDWSDLNNGTVTGTAGYTAKTRDGGQTWKERNPGSSTITGVSMVGTDTVYAACDRNVSSAIFRLIDPNTSVTFNLTIGIEAFWDGVTQVSDTVKCHLRSSTSPFAEVGIASTVLNSSGTGTFVFDVAPSGSYYLEITHRNSLETWSSLPQAVNTGGSYSYDFTTAASQAFGNNLTQISGRYCDYSGDVNQDGSINLTDLLETYNASSSFTIGYVVTDINADNTVDLSDITFVYNNSRAFVFKISP